MFKHMSSYANSKVPTQLKSHVEDVIEIRDNNKSLFHDIAVCEEAY